MNPRELLLLARFTVTGYGGLIELQCKNCDTAKTFGTGDELVELPEVVIWARDHKCRAEPLPFRRSARRDLVVA